MLIDEGELQSVGSFLLAKGKRLDGDQPAWSKQGKGDFQAIWPIVEADGRIRSQLRFRVNPDYRDFPSISLIFRDRNITRMDLVSSTECERNPVSAFKLGLPPVVCGPHLHLWGDNEQAVATSGTWELPVRRPLTDPITSLRQMFFRFCDLVNISLEHSQRDFIDPPRDLFN